MTNITIPNFQEIKNIWENAEQTKNTEWKAYQQVKRCWDNYQKDSLPHLTPPSTEIITRLKNTFTGKQFQYSRPLGDFKELCNLTHEEIYNTWTQTITKPQTTKPYIEEYIKTIIDIIIKTVTTEQQQRGWTQLTPQQIVTGYCMMLYRTSTGMALEPKVIRILNATSPEHIKAEPATPEEEQHDVDCWLISSKTGNKVPVSIKTLNSINPTVIEGFRKKGKTKPQLYVGLNNQHTNKLTYIYITHSPQEIFNILN